MTQPTHTGRPHALLSASSADRWINCTPSARLEEQYPDTPSEAAQEGTTAHEHAEHKLRQLLGENPTPPTTPIQDEEMQEHTTDYANQIAKHYQKAKQIDPATHIAIEQRLNYSHIAPGGFGTTDALIIEGDTITVIDFKYGKGVEVSAENNPQMRLYALAALHQYGIIYNIKNVRMIIIQPRLNNTSVSETTTKELLEWAEQVVKPKAQLANTGEGKLTPGKWCTFCKHAPQCPALASIYLDPLPPPHTPPPPDTLTDTQIAHIVEISTDIKKWLTSVEDHALTQANNGHTYPGLKLVEGRSIRRYKDETAVAETLTKAGYDPYEQKLLGITALQKQLGKKLFDKLITPHLHKPAGKPTLVPESDKRPALVVSTPENTFTALNP
ncbi:DUF2800 domain-containing protein [Corynebacterium kutscheri]|uniref:DUF2800 domain-containing protein n=1 Tax=Corynebacterium kutscheri TaxID=35755 RepID=UPI0037C177C4